MIRGRRLAFDYGDVRIGVAISDHDCILASPLKVLRTQDARLQKDISALLSESTPVKIFVGLPMNMSGTEGESAEKARLFVNFLSTLTDTPIELLDERLSTVTAASKLRESGLNSKDSKELIDAMAAVEILEAGLVRERNI